MTRMIVPKAVAALLALLVAAGLGAAEAAPKAAPKATLKAAPIATPIATLGAKAARTSKHAERGVTCAQCHGKTAKKELVPMQQCLSCHGDTKELAARTAKVKPTNPHENRHFGTETDCNRCHHEHAVSENLCLPCHRFHFKVP